MASKSYSPTVKDVFRVKAALRAKLPPEIIDVIIDFPEYWPHVTNRMMRRIVIVGSSPKDIECLRASPLCYDMVRPIGPIDLQTTGVCSNMALNASRNLKSKSKTASPRLLLPYRSLHPCRKIVFSILSNDQGFGGSFEHNRTYEYSYTWFDAIREPWPTPNSQPPKPEHPFLPKSKTFQKNKQAHNDSTRQDIIWSYLDNLDPDSDMAQKLATKLGRERATMNGEFVRQMEVGDSVAPWARVRFASWQNKVHNAEVKVFWAV